MSTLLERPPVRAMPDRRGPVARPLRVDRRPALSLRFAAFAALVLYGCEHWVRQVAPTATRPALQMTAVAVAVAAAALLLGLVRVERRPILLGALSVVAGVAALTAAGIPLRFVGWRNWGLLVDGAGGGLSALPNLNVPYRGLDDWVRWIVLAGAGLLGVLAALLAFLPGPRSSSRIAAAALTLGVLYGLPVIERNPESPYLSGAGFALLLALFLGADRLTAVRGIRPGAFAYGGGLAALLIAAVVAPRLDRGSPWIDYRGIAGDFAERNQAVFNWNHSYAPLRWPRDGRELIRVKAEEPAYWKATTLRRFDGLRWIEQAPADPTAVDTPMAADHPEWNERIRVTMRGLRSEQFLTAGFAKAIGGVSVPAVPAGTGTFQTGGQPLRPGDTYTADVYTPRPTPAEMREAGTGYPRYVLGEPLSIELPESVGGPKAAEPFSNGVRQTTIFFPPFGSDARSAATTRPTAVVPGVRGFVGGDDLLAASGYGRMWTLAQQLRDEATSPFDLVRMVRRRVQQGTRYTEQPEQRAIPLEAFLFDTKGGYCQQFSGAMALLLRMAGVPARVASGFTSGSLDSRNGEYIVRDLDAHSWVEAFFPGIGWVTFDPTPTVAPPAAQETGDGGGGPTDTGTEDNAQARADVAEPVPPTPSASQPDSTGSGGSSALLITLGVLLAAALVAALWWRHARRTAPTPLEELSRALLRSGRATPPGLTLRALEERLATAPAAAAYVRTIRLARYSGSEERPAPGDRAAFRAELAAGGGLGGRLRAWWSLPPRRPHP